MLSDRIYLCARHHLKRASAILRAAARQDLCSLVGETARLLEAGRHDKSALDGGESACNIVVLDQFRRRASPTPVTGNNGPHANP